MSRFSYEIALTEAGKCTGANRTDHVNDDFGQGSPSIEIPLLKDLVLHAPRSQSMYYSYC